MGKVNSCLKRVYIILTALFGVSGVLLLGISLFSHGAVYNSKDGILVGIKTCYALGSIIVLLSIIGIYGACKEVKWALISFTVVWSLTITWILISGLVILAHTHSGIHEDIKDLKSLPIPLSQASNEDKDELNYMQIHLECCGVNQGYQDWGYDIPETCRCAEDSVSECVVAPNNTRLYKEDESYMIYEKACPQMIDHSIIMATTLTTIFISVCLILIIPVALCITIVIQLYRRQADVPTVVYTAEAKAGNYSCLVESSDGVVI